MSDQNDTRTREGQARPESSSTQPDTADRDESSDQSQGSDSSGSDESSGSQNKNALEWGATIAGAAIVLFVVGFFVYELFAGASGPAELTISLGTPSRKAMGIEVPVEVQNEGARVAEAAVVEVCAGTDNCAQLTFDYVPYKSKLTGSVGFEAPLSGPLTARIVSYRDP